MYENLPLLLISILISVISLVSLVFLRMWIYNCLGRKKTVGTTQSVQVTQNNRIRSTPATISEFTPSDHQLVFARMPPPQPNIRRLNADTSVTQIVQEIDEQFHSDRLQIEYDRRAQERREALDRSMYSLHMPPSLDDNVSAISMSNERRTMIYPNAPTEPLENNYSNTTPAPRYNFQDDQLPSYEEAIWNK